jgi:hypothetical protein
MRRQQRWRSHDRAFSGDESFDRQVVFPVNETNSNVVCDRRCGCDAIISANESWDGKVVLYPRQDIHFKLELHQSLLGLLAKHFIMSGAGMEVGVV